VWLHVRWQSCWVDGSYRSYARVSSLPRQLLVLLAALKPDSLAITDLGRAMAAFPLAPRFAKMCVLRR